MVPAIPHTRGRVSAQAANFGHRLGQGREGPVEVLPSGAFPGAEIDSEVGSAGTRGSWLRPVGRDAEEALKAVSTRLAMTTDVKVASRSPDTLSRRIVS